MQIKRITKNISVRVLPCIHYRVQLGLLLRERKPIGADLEAKASGAATLGFLCGRRLPHRSLLPQYIIPIVTQYSIHFRGNPSPLTWWVQFPPAMQFSAARIPLSLASAGPTGMVVPEREQAAPTTAARMQEGECWTIA
jgi:hypothetical protein